MSATVYWRSRKKTPPSFNVGAPSAFGEIMGKRFGGEPWRVGENDLAWLNGVRDAGNNCADWDEIIVAVEKHGEIEIWREY